MNIRPVARGKGSETAKPLLLLCTSSHEMSSRPLPQGTLVICVDGSFNRREKIKINIIYLVSLDRR